MKNPKMIFRPLTLLMILAVGLPIMPGCRDDGSAEQAGGGVLDALARPQPGRSMRATSTMRVGELRRGPDGNRDAGERRYDPTADPRGDADVQSNWDNFNVPPARPTSSWTRRARASSPTSGSPSSARSPRAGRRRARPTTRSSCCGCTGTATRGRPWRRPSAISSPTASASAAEVISVPVVVEDADSYNCFWRMPFRKSARIEIENQSDKPLSLLYLQHRLDQAGHAARGHALLLRPVPPGISRRQGQGLRPPRDPGQGPLRRHGPGRPDAQPGLVRRGRREDLHRRRGEALDLGHRDRGLLPLGLGPREDEHALLRRAVLRLPGDRRPHQLPTAGISTIPIVFNTGIKVTIEHMGWMSAGREPRVQGHELERAGGRLRQRGLLVPDRRAHVRRAGPGSRRAAPARSRPDGRRGLGSRRAPAPRGRRGRQSGRRD